MANSILGRAFLVGVFAGSVAIVVALLMSCNSPAKVHTSNFRLMCWLPNGEVFYNGTASRVEARGGGLTFVPDIGPQTGMIINTTNACTWAQL